MIELAPLLGWLEGPGRRLIETEAFVEALGEQLVEIGLPIDRITTGIPMLHPQIASSSVVWEPARLAHERQWQMTSLTRSMYERSPLYVVYRGDGPVRARRDTGGAAGRISHRPRPARGRLQRLHRPARARSPMAPSRP